MSNIKKLSDKLSKAFNPKNYEIITSDSKKKLLLEATANPSMLGSKKVIYHDIPSLKMTAAKYSICSISSPLIGLANSLVVVHNNLQENKWIHNDYSIENHQVFINPKIVKFTTQTETLKEECPCIPLFYYEVERSAGVVIEYYNTNGVKIEEDLYGFKARVLQHEIDHLEGKTISNLCVSGGRSVEKYTFKEFDKVQKEWENLTNEEVKKLELLYKKDKKFKEKTDAQKNKKEYFMKIVLGTEKYKDYEDSLRFALQRDMMKTPIN